ncbi:MAG: hypothetical protein RLY49_167 [Candidatus Parcubacteria bacterium]|jgi:hypothetical protein
MLKKYNMKFKIFTLIIVLASIIPLKTQAVVPMAVPFGGPIVMTYECSCSGGWLVVTYDYMTKMPVPMTFQFGQSMLRANYNIFTPSVQTLGSYIPGGVCLMASADCGGFSTQGTISPIGFPGIGTSSI